MPGEDFHFELLRRLAQEPEASQRNLATRMGVSVGKVNYCLRALADKGWVKAANFRRSDNKWAYAYLLTPLGAAAKLRLARSFLARKVSEFEALHGEIESLRRELTDELPPPDTTDTAGNPAADKAKRGETV
jgi:MarR family transcriptional regulator, temperature-dependent positive regulator of motility